MALLYLKLYHVKNKSGTHTLRLNQGKASQEHCWVFEAKPEEPTASVADRHAAMVRSLSVRDEPARCSVVNANCSRACRHRQG